MTAATGIKIISMDESTQRRADLTREAHGRNITQNFFPAYKSIVEPLRYSAKDAKRRFGRELSVGEIGCYTSHFKCWEWLANSKEYDQAIIMEDDIIIDWNVINALEKCRISDYGINYLRLFTTHPVKWNIAKFRFLSAHYHLIRTTGTVFGTQGYMLTKAAATRLLNYRSVSSPVDWILARYWEHGLGSYSLFPFPIIERHIPSSIGDQRHAVGTVGFADKLHHLGWRIMDNAKMRVCNFSMVGHRPLGTTKDEGPPFITGCVPE